MLVTPKPLYRSPPSKAKTKADLQPVAEQSETSEISDTPKAPSSTPMPDFSNVKLSLKIPDYICNKKPAELHSSESEATQELMDIFCMQPLLDPLSQRGSLRVPQLTSTEPASPIIRRGNPLPENSLFDAPKHIVKKGLKIKVQMEDSHGGKIYNGPFSAGDATHHFVL